MRSASDRGVEKFVMRTCKTCGKKFLPAPYHQYVSYELTTGTDNYRKLWFCSYSCLNKYRTEREENPTGKRAIVMCGADGGVIKAFANAQAAAMFLSDMGYRADNRKIQAVCKSGKPYHGFYFKHKEEEK